MRSRRLMTIALGVAVYGTSLGGEPQRQTSFKTRPGSLERKADESPWSEAPPNRTKRVAPVYPAGVQDIIGVVTLQVTLDKSGRVVELRPVQFLVPGAAQESKDEKTIAQLFASAAMDAVSAWEYESAKRPVTFLMNVVIRPSSGGSTGAGVTEDEYLDGQSTLEPIKKTRAVYPVPAKNQLIQGVIILESTIGPDGKVLDSRVLRAIPWLDQAALDAVATWEFGPRKGSPSGASGNVVTPVILNFMLRESLP